MSAAKLQQQKERPKNFNTAEVRATLAGTKTQFREVIKGVPSDALEVFVWFNESGHQPSADEGLYCRDKDGLKFLQACPYKTGSRLWVRETWAWPGEEFVLYRATEGHIQQEMQSDPNNPQFVWQSPVTMPRWASRIWLEVVSVKVERLNEISYDDARAEGLESVAQLGILRAGGWKDYTGKTIGFMNYADSFTSLWDSVNGKRAGCAWQDNPWCWCIGFRRVEVNQ
jgi:hypothetical protein